MATGFEWRPAGYRPLGTLPAEVVCLDTCCGHGLSAGICRTCVQGRAFWLSCRRQMRRVAPWKGTLLSCWARDAFLWVFDRLRCCCCWPCACLSTHAAPYCGSGSVRVQAAMTVGSAVSVAVGRPSQPGLAGSMVGPVSWPRKPPGVAR